MSKGESRTPETSRITATSEDSRVEVERNRLTKVAHFIPVKTTYSGAKLAELYM
jgi:hypothetical protein